MFAAIRVGSRPAEILLGLAAIGHDMEVRFDLGMAQRPFQKENVCTAREPRPLGCRVYFCDPAYQETGNEITEKYLRRLKDLADELSLGWRYGPLHIFLNEGEARGREAPQDQNRIPLPLAPNES